MTKGNTSGKGKNKVEGRTEECINLQDEKVFKYIKKARQIINAAKRDEEELIRAGLPTKYIDIIASRVSNFEKNEVALYQKRDYSVVISKEWNLKHEELNHLMLDLLCSFVYSFERGKMDRSELNTILSNLDSESHEDILKWLVRLGRSKEEYLLKEYFDLERITEAEAILEEIQAMHRISKEYAEEYIGKKIQHKNVYRFLQFGIENIQNFARMAFVHTPEKLRDYYIIDH